MNRAPTSAGEATSTNSSSASRRFCPRFLDRVALAGDVELGVWRDVALALTFDDRRALLRHAPGRYHRPLRLPAARAASNRDQQLFAHDLAARAPLDCDLTVHLEEELHGLPQALTSLLEGAFPPS